MEPGDLTDECKVFCTESPSRDHSQDVAFVVEETHTLLEGDAGDNIKGIPVHVRDHVDRLSVLLLHQIDEDLGALINMGLVVAQVGHGVHLSRGAPQDPVLLEIADSEHVVQRFPFIERWRDAVEVRLEGC